MSCGYDNPSDHVRMCLENLPWMLNNDTWLLLLSLIITDPSGNPMAVYGPDICLSSDPRVPPKV